MLHSLIFRTTHATLFGCCPSLLLPGAAFIGLKDLQDFFFFKFCRTHACRLFRSTSKGCFKWINHQQLNAFVRTDTPPSHPQKPF